ncbi:hypothetical protein GCM10007938_36640 [Vibrio zhanjiangensis]|uniref:Uncharacterized protein n=1 Tax=Vibrio zhanjiangensis TaxID=1046128 RepID=A0ABQ6F3T2_9VIBR|nr:hypothetical protein [Vibrio zhanjiangensis]GLT19881.1 hypothetical protein GCM10007938_36640 [Vibrio zhanjiangensis]
MSDDVTRVQNVKILNKSGTLPIDLVRMTAAFPVKYPREFVFFQALRCIGI